MSRRSDPARACGGAPGTRRLPWPAAAGLLLAAAVVAGPALGGEAGPPPDEPGQVRLEVKGRGWWKGRELRRMLRILESDEGLPALVDAVFIEDASLLLQADTMRDGYLHAAGTVEVWSAGERLGSFAWNENELPRLPRDVAADRVVFRLEPGVRYSIASLEFRGLTGPERQTATSFFVSTGLVLEGAGARVFTPAGLRQGLGSVRELLARDGFADAAVTVVEEVRDARTGRVNLVIAVERGRRHEVASVVVAEGVPEAVAEAFAARCKAARGRIYSPWWEQDLRQDLRGLLFAAGYPEAEVTLVLEAATPDGDRVLRNYRAEAAPGPEVHVGAIRFTGDDHTREHILLRATETREGDLFDRSRIERDRLELSMLGTFSSVRAEAVRVEPDRWDLEYQLRPAKRLELGLHAGYGSYEQLRGGLDLFQSNLFGRAHRARLQLVGSMKAASADYNYIVPQVFGTRADGSVRFFGLTREEVSFERREYGVSAGVRRRIARLGAESALRYQLESLDARPYSPDLAAETPSDSKVAALTFDLTRDRRDNPVNPRRGYLLSLTLEVASGVIGSTVDYGRLEVRSSWHHKLAAETTFHAGFRSGVLSALDGTGEDLPLNKRFFPGGETTVRGYREGRAAPRDINGEVIGADVSSILNLELEQSLTRNLAVLVFVDTGLTAARLDDFPGNELRVSAGLGLRYHTLIGPVRLEYGYNVVRESGDAASALHFSLGFPF
jgi:outer membrane protein insertion porin family